MGRRAIAFPDVQQQQVHGRDDADCAGRRSYRRAHRICALGPDRTPGIAAHITAALRRFSYQTSACFSARGAPRGVQRSRARGRHDRWRSRDRRVPGTRRSSRRCGRLHMKQIWLAIRSAILWSLSILHFFIVAPTLVFLGIFLDARKHDWLQRTFCRRIAFLSGAQVEARRSSGFDPQRTCFFMSNHVNLFDPFMLYCAIPQFVRGWELESHFKIPAYGWLMKRFGNVPVPNVRRSSDLKRMWRLTQDAVDGGTSLIIFPEAKRTRDGHVDQFQDGGFRVAQQLGIPIVPVSLVGSFQHHRTGHWMLWPAKITVHLHDPIETGGLTKEDVPALRERVREIISAPVGEALRTAQEINRAARRPAQESVL